MKIVITTKKMALALVLSLALGGGATHASAWVSSSTAAYTEVTGALLESNGVDSNGGERYASESDAGEYGEYNAQTCAALYGTAICAAFERCMAAYGFNACYERFTQ